VWSTRWSWAFAAKIAWCADGETNDASIDAEVASLRHLEHPNVIQMYDHWVEQGLRLIILEFCPQGSLADLIQAGPLPPVQIPVWFRAIAEILSACHAQEIAHRDIKPANILIDVHGRPELADFGLGIAWCHGDMMHNSAGSILFAPPEILMVRPYDPFKADVWSLGVSLYMMILRGSPWTLGSLASVKAQIRTGRLQMDRDKFGQDEVMLLTGMVDVDPRRPMVGPFMQRRRTGFANPMELGTHGHVRPPSRETPGPRA